MLALAGRQLLLPPTQAEASMTRPPVSLRQHRGCHSLHGGKRLTEFEMRYTLTNQSEGGRQNDGSQAFTTTLRVPTAEMIFCASSTHCVPRVHDLCLCYS